MIGRARKKLPGPLFRVSGNLYGLQIGRIRTINTPRLKKTESKPENQVEIPLSDQSSAGKFRVCQQDSRRNKFEKNKQKPKDSQNKIGAPSTGPQKVSTIIKNPGPEQAPKQVPTEIKHSDKSAGRIHQPDPTAPPADRQSVQVAQKDKKRCQHSAQDTSDVL